jgi:FkbM family methyltransferase
MKKVNREGIEFLVDNSTSNSEFWDLDCWENDNYKIIKEFSSKCSCFVNAGAWIGPFTIFASKIYPKVYCLEPDPLAYKELKKNIEINNTLNIDVEFKALYNINTTIDLGSDYSDLGCSGTSIFQKNHGIKVDTITLREFFKTKSISKNSFLLLDVEGAEYVLFDDTDFFKEYSPIILIEFHTKFMNENQKNHFKKKLLCLSSFYKIDNDVLNFSKVHNLLRPL